MESPNTDLQTIELNLSCSRQDHSNRPGTGRGYESIEPGCNLTVFRVPSMICSLRASMPSLARLFTPSAPLAL